ncbi:MAG: lactate utilization protein [Candidatus Rokubacteria bacterium]|nr:lactate utilization protein [Candidatus Rokubacteria bacterium]
MTTRAEFLDRIRAEMRTTGGLFVARPAERPARPADAAEIVRRQLAERWPETLERFRAEFERVGGVFHRVARVADVPAVVGTLARERAARRLVAWHPTGIGADLAAPLAAQGLDVDVVTPGSGDAERQRIRAASAVADLGLTGVDLAVAETGTLVLRSGAGRPRSTSLLPPCHVAVFDRTTLVESLDQVGVLLESWHAEEQERWGAMINFITGPSRTADIELTLTRGVHGPKEVHAIFVDERLGG